MLRIFARCSAINHRTHLLVNYYFNLHLQPYLEDPGLQIQPAQPKAWTDRNWSQLTAYPLTLRSIIDLFLLLLASFPFSLPSVSYSGIYHTEQGRCK